TKMFEDNQRPLTHEVIPLMDTISHKLDDIRDNTEEHHLVRVAAQKGAALLNKYYSKTDDTFIYRAAMLMHPSFKTAYFENAGWPLSWVQAAKKSLTDHWEHWYK
ncbi:hypothetical protein K435DRAFT_627715, partial [Dendrothele bispora CBS 962.96]